MNSPVKRAASLVVAFSMLFTGTARADLSTVAPSLNLSEKNFPFSIDVPFDLGTVEEIRTPDSGFSGPVVVMVQTLHGHYETALKIKGLIDYLHSNHAVNLLFAEGGSGPLHPEYLRFTEDSETNAKILDELVRKGEMTGADLALSEGRVKGIGIENAASYKHSYEAFKNVLGRHAANEKALESARLDLDRRASRVIGAELRAILSGWLKFGSGQLDLAAAVDFLRAQAPSVLGVDFEMAFTQFEWPQVTRLVLLSELGRRQNQESWAVEKSTLIEKIETLGLDKSFPGFLEARETAAEPRRKVEQFMSLAAPAGLKLTDYPQAVYKAASKVLESEIDSRQLYEEISRLFERILSSTVRSPEEQILVEEYKQLRLADKLLRLELSPQEWRDWQSLGAAPAALNMEALTETLKQAEGFYLSLEAREQSFLESIDQTLRSTKSKTAVLVAGGFHGREMMDKLENLGIGSVLVTPHISGDLEETLYQKIMLRGATLEQTLLSNGAQASVSQGWDVRAQSEAVRQTLKDQGSEVAGDIPYFSAVNDALALRSELRAESGEYKLAEKELDIKVLFSADDQDKPLEQIVFISDNTGTMVENYGEPLSGTILSDAAFLLNSGKASVVINSGDPLRDLSAKTYKPLLEALTPEMRTRFHIVADGGSRRIGFKEDGSARYFDELESWPKERRFAYARVLADAFYKELKKRKGRLAEGLKDVRDEAIDRIREERVKALEALGPEGWGETKPGEAKFMFDLMPENYRPGWGRIFVYDVGPKVSLDAPVIRDYLPADFMPGAMEDVQKTYPEGTDDLYVVSVPGAVDMARVSKVQGVEKTLGAEVYPKLDAARPVLMVVIGDGDNDIPTFSLKSPEGLPAAVVPVFLRDSANYSGRLPEQTWIGAFKLAGTAQVLRHLAEHAGKKIADIPPLKLRQWVRSELRSEGAEAIGLDGRLEGLDLYEKVFSNAPDTTLRVGRDIAHTGALQASAIIRGIQEKRKAYDAEGQKDRDVFIIFATGNTQWLGLTTLASILDSWGSWDEETRQLLISNGVDLSDKPDMGRIFATHLDTIFPQSRDDYYSYANELHNMFDKLGISREKRRMFYGDVKNDLIEPGTDNQMDKAAFEKVQASIDEEGLKLNEFLSGQLASDHAQYAYLDAVNRYTKKMSEFVLAKGPDIALFSAGPSYEGKGHFAFNEAGTPFDQGLVMALLSYHAAAGNIKDRGGMQHFRTPSSAIKIGGATLGPKEIRSNNPVFITIINGKEKRESVRSLVERTADIQYPMTALQSGASGSVLIMESASGSTLRYFTNTWDFAGIPAREWSGDLRAKLFVRLSKETGKPVSALTVDDWLNSPGKDQAEIAAFRTKNLVALTALQPWEVLRDEVVKTLSEEPLKSEQVPARLGLRSGDEIVHIGPHLDDLSLAAQFLVSEFSKQGHRLYSYYTAPGYTAVSDEYVLSALGTLTDFKADELAALEDETRSVSAFKQNEEKYLRQLINVLAARDLVYDPMNYDTWSQMPTEEQRLRAKLLFLRLNFESSLKGQLSSPGRVTALRDALEIYIKAKPHWGSSEIVVMQKLKVALRFVEEQTELMSRGVGYDDIFFPFQSSWYALERKGTARQSDIDVIKDVIRTKKPRMVIVNGEGFMDHGAHSITEMTVKVAVKELYEEGSLPDGFRMFFYRGVWDRAEITGRPDQILVALGEEELNENKSSFVRNYPSQAPALVPDASVKEPMFFSDQVVTNARETLAEWAALNGRATDDPALQGILAFDMIDFNSRSAVESFLAEVVAKKTELDRVQVPINRASLSKIIGSAPPYADLSGEPGEQFLSVLAAAGFPFETVLTKEEIEKAKLETRSELRTEELPGDPELLQLSGSASDFDRNPFPAIEKMAGWFAQHRWFMEKGNTVKAIEYVDAFILGEENGSFVHGLIVRLKLANAEGQEFTKQYFIPVIVSQAKPEGVDSKEMVLVRLPDGERYLSLAEHQGLYQKMLLEHFQNRKEAGTWNQGRVVFSPSDSTLQGISASDVSAGPLGVSTSNVLTKVTSAETSVVSKTYKDMRGVSGQGDRVWPANTEVPKYEALVKGNYPYMPPLYGTMDYVSSSGQRTALGLMMKAVKAETEAGGVFWEGLTRFMKTLKASDPESGKATQKALEGASIFSRELAGTVAEMHTAFLKSGSAGFTAASASGGEIQGWERSGQQHLAEALSSLDQRISANPGAENLKRLRAEFVKRSEAVKDAKNALDEFEGVLMKAPVHGDLSTAQGLIEALGDAKLNREYWDMTERGAPADVASKAKALIKQVRWLDFEGPPAKESVAPYFDQRENWIKDAAGVLEGFWYIANIQLFNFLELNPQERPEDREEARKASLVLAGYADVSELARGINPEVIRLINQWVTETTNAFLDGYFDTLEKEGYGNAILSRWNRQTARDLVDYYLMERAMHEFHYEFYAREWGWEGIPGTRILQLTDSGRLTKAPGEVRTFTASDSTVFGGALTEVAEVPKKEFFSPIDAAIPVDGVFFPFHHMRHADDWGVGNFYTAKAAGDFAHAMGYHVMQDLPFTYSSAGNSPYSVLSALLLDPVYLSAPEAVRMLERSGIPVAGWQEFLNENGSKIEALKNNPQIQHQEIINLNLAAIRLVWDALQQHQDSPLWQAFESFKQDHQEMAEDDLLYLQLKTELGGDWRNWEAGLRDRDPVSLRGARERFKPELDFQAFVQYVLDLQKQERDAHYQKLGVSTMVDMAFAPPDAEIWKNPAAVGMHKENAYRRDAVQGVPGKKEAPVGQLWNFSVYDWSNPAALALFIKVFKINLDRADYLRVDHTLGLYRIFVFLQKGLSLAELGIEGQIAAIRERALRENTEEAKSRAVLETWELIRAALLEKGRELGLPPEVFTLVFDENGQLRKGGNMVMAVRKVPRDQHEQKLPMDSRWQRLHWEEDDLFEGEPKWDTIRLTPNERAQDNGDIRTWLFPEDGRDPAKADDQIRLGYFRLSPGETAMSELSRIAQETGKKLIFETLGTVPEPIQRSSSRFGNNYYPLVYGLDPSSWYNPLKIKTQSGMMTFNVADTGSPEAAWAGLQDWFGVKGPMVRAFFPDMPGEQFDPHMRGVTPEIHEKLLQMVYDPQGIYPQIPEAHLPLIALLGLIDIANLPESYRLNIPGQGGQWINRLPKDLSLEDLTAAAKGEAASEAAKKAVQVVRSLQEKRARHTPLKVSKDVRILRTTPDVREAGIQIRTVSKMNPASTPPFFVEAAVQGDSKRVDLVVRYKDGREARFDVRDIPSARGNNPEVSNVGAMLRPEKPGIYEFHFEIEKQDLTREVTATGHLIAVPEGADLNPMSPDYVLTPDARGFRSELRTEGGDEWKAGDQVLDTQFLDTVYTIEVIDSSAGKVKFTSGLEVSARQLGMRFVRAVSAAAALLPADEQEFRDKADAAGLRVGDRYGIGTAVYTFLDIVRHPQHGMAFLFRVEKNGQMPEDGYLIPDYFQSFKQAARLILDAEPGAVQELTSSQAEVFAPLVSKSADQGLITKHLEGERAADMTADEELWNLLPADVREKIERVIAEYRDHWKTGDIEREDGFSNEKRAVKIAWKGIIRGEEIDGIIVSGVLFNRDNIGEDFRGLTWGSTGTGTEDLDEETIRESAINVQVAADGRPDLRPAAFAQKGGHGGKTAVRKFRNARTTLPAKGLRTPVAVGYALYTPEHIKKDGEPLGVFISAHRKTEKRFKEYQEKAVQGLLKGYLEAVAEVKRRALTTFQITYFDPAQVIPELLQENNIDVLSEVYGRELRKVIDAGLYPHSPHFANFEADPSGRLPTTWHDLGGWEVSEELTPEQAFGYAYMTLTYAMLNLKIRFGNRLEEFYNAGYIHPYHAFFKGFFHDQLQNPDFNLDDFSLDRDGRSSLEYAAYDAVYRDEPGRLQPLYKRLDQPFVKVLREVMGMPVSAEERGLFKPDSGARMVRPRPVSENVLAEEWEDGEGVNVHRMYEQMRQSVGMEAVGPQFVQEYIVPELKALVTPETLDEVVEYGAGAGTLWDWAHDGFADWYPGNPRYPSWIQTDMNMDALRMSRGHVKKIIPVDLREEPILFKEKAAAVSWAGLDTLPVPEIPAVVRSIAETLKPGGKLIVGLDMGASVTAESFEAGRNGWVAFPYFTDLTPGEGRPSGMMYLDWPAMKRSFRPGPRDQAVWPMIQQYMAAYTAKDSSAETVIMHALQSKEGAANLQMISRWIEEKARAAGFLRHIAVSRPALHIERIQRAAEAAGFSIQSAGEISKTYFIDRSAIPGLRPGINHIVYSEGMVVQKVSRGVDNGKVRVDAKFHLLTAVKTGEPKEPLAYTPLGIGVLNGGKLQGQKPKLYQIAKMLPAPGVEQPAALSKAEILKRTEAAVRDALQSDKVRKPAKRFEESAAAQQIARDLSGTVGLLTERDVNSAFSRARLGFTQSGHGAEIAKRLNEILGRSELRTHVNVQEEKAPEAFEEENLRAALIEIAEGRNPSVDELEKLERLMDEDAAQSVVTPYFGTDKTRIVEERIELLRKVWPAFREFWQTQVLSSDVPADSLWRVYLPLAQWTLSEKRTRRPDELFVVGIGGAIGSGKTTLSRVIALLLNEMMDQNEGQAVARSLDDYYLPKETREKLREKGYAPGMRVNRALPGTQDVDWMLRDIQAMEESGPETVLDLPSFSKLKDQHVEPYEITGKVGVFVFEGWLNGAPTDADPALADEGLKRVVAEEIRKYAPVFDRFDALLAFPRPSVERMILGRIQQDDHQAKTSGRREFTDAQIESLIRYWEADYWQTGLTSPSPRHEDVTLWIEADESRNLLSVKAGGRWTGRSELRAAEEKNSGWLREELGLSEDEVISLASSEQVRWRMRDLHSLLSARFPGKLSTLTVAGGSAAFAYSLGLAAPYKGEIERVYDQFLGYAEKTSEALALTDFRMLNSVYEKLSVYLGEPVVKLSDRPVYQRTFLREIPERLAALGAETIPQTAEGKPHLAGFLKDRPNTAGEEDIRQGLLEWLNVPDSEGKTWNLPVFRTQFLELFPEYDSPRFDHGFLLWTLDLAFEFKREDDARSSRLGGVDTFVGQSFGFTREKSTRKMRALREHLEALELAKLRFESPEDAADLADYVYQPAALGQIQDLRKIRVLEALSSEAGRSVGSVDVLDELGSPEIRWNIPEFYKRHASITWLRTRGYHTFFYAAQMEIPMRRILRERYDLYAGNMKLVAESFGMDPKAMRDFYAAMGMDLSLLYVSRGHFLKLLGQDKQVYLDRIQKEGWQSLPAWKEEVMKQANSKLSDSGSPQIVLKNISHADIVWGLDLAGEFLKEFRRLRETEGMTMLDASRAFGFVGEKSGALTLLKRIEEGIREKIKEEKKLSLYVFDIEDLRARLRKAYAKDRAAAVRIKRAADGVWETLRSGYYFESNGGESAFVSSNVSSVLSKVKGPYKLTQQDSFLLIEQAVISAKVEESLEPAVRSELRMDPIKPVSPAFAAQFRNYSLPAEETELRDRKPEKPAIVLSPDANFSADSREAALYFALDGVLGSHPVLGMKDIDPQDGYLITKASDLPGEDVFKSWFLIPRGIDEAFKTQLFQQLKPGGILIMAFEEGIVPDPAQFDETKAQWPPEIATAVYGSVKTQVQRRDDVIPYVIVQKSRSELREASTLSERDALSIPAVRLPFVAVPTGRAAYDAALMLAGMADPSWQGEALNDFRQALVRAVESYYRSAGGEGFEEQVSKVQAVLRENKQVIALFAHIEDLSADPALRQIFETAAFLAEENQAKAHYVVLTVDRAGDAEILRDKLLAFLREKYPEDAGLRNQLYARLPVAAAADPAITRLLPKGAVSVWVDWNSDTQDTTVIPEPAREKQVRADQLPSGEVLQFDETNRGYGVSLLQAVLLLLQGEEDSRLQQIRSGIYAQSSKSALAGIGQVLKALQLISKSA